MSDEYRRDGDSDGDDDGVCQRCGRLEGTLTLDCGEWVCGVCSGVGAVDRIVDEIG
jgi:hypothetical protein